MDQPEYVMVAQAVTEENACIEWIEKLLCSFFGDASMVRSLLRTEAHR